MVSTTPAPADVGARPHHLVYRAALALAVAAVLAQVAHPLLSGDVLHATTVGAVVLFAAAALVDAGARFGLRGAVLLLAAAGGIGLVAEAVGVATGFPFGEYRYTGSLGPEVLDVPVVVPLAWTMMAYPTLLAGRALTSPRSWGAVPLAALGLASWDLFLDPMMVAEGHWVWADPHPALPGIPGVPLSNFGGWLLVALVVQAVLHRALPRSPDPGSGSAVPALLLGWTWLGSTVGNLVFFDRPWVALWGFVVMGAVAGPALAHWLWLAGPARRRAPGSTARP